VERAGLAGDRAATEVQDADHRGGDQLDDQRRGGRALRGVAAAGAASAAAVVAAAMRRASMGAPLVVFVETEPGVGGLIRVGA
jgi:hypothetical protein